MDLSDQRSDASFLRVFTFTNYVGERSSEVPAEHAVDDGVDGRVGVAQPSEDGQHQLRYAVLVAAVTADQVGGEEGKPANDEYANDDADGFGRFRLRQQPLGLPLAGGVGSSTEPD